MRGLEPSKSAVTMRDGVRIAYDIYGAGEKTIVLFPCWSIVHSRIWKAQIPYLAKYARVVTFDGRGNGRSDKTPELDYSDEAFAADAIAVMDATQTSRATFIALSAGARWALMVAARHPERVERLICIAPAIALAPQLASRAAATAAFENELESYDGWFKLNRNYWREGYRDFLEFFFAEALPEPHSTKQFEDAVEWALETTPETLAATVVAAQLAGDEARALAAAVRCPVLVMHGDADKIVSLERGRAFADATRGRFVLLEGSGHLPQARDPVRINTEIRNFILPRLAGKRRYGKRKRVLFISSPIGLGHARRDAAIAAELRKLRVDVDVHWLAQHPVTEVLRRSGENIHPASALLASESAHIESECGEHDLNAFGAIRRMDEILIRNYMVFHDLVREEHFDLVVGDEAWDVDHFLHENPSEKRTAFVWLTDFVGWLPMPGGGDYEARLTADYNAEMLEHIERHSKVRDRSIFIGDPEDIVPHSFGKGLPLIREWTAQHYAFSGYVTGFDPPTVALRDGWREQFGYNPDDLICIVTVGGSAAGLPLLRRIIAAYPEAKRRLPSLRMIVVAGPRIDPTSLPNHPGLEVHGYVPELYRHLAACDIALVQGGLTTTMELTSAGRPFVYFPLQNHFEQNYHVAHRLERFGVGTSMDYADATPEHITEAIVTAMKRAGKHRPLISDGARVAAELVSTAL